MKLSIALFALLSFFCAVRAAARVCEAVNGDASVSFCSHIQYDVSRPSDLTFAEMDALALSSYLSSRAAFDQDCCKAVSRLDICANFFPKCEAGTTNPLPPCPLYTCSASFSFISSFSPSYMCQAGEPGQCSNATKVTADMSCSCQDGSDKSNAECVPYDANCVAGVRCTASDPSSVESCACNAQERCSFLSDDIASAVDMPKRFCAYPPAELLTNSTTLCESSNSASTLSASTLVTLSTLLATLVLLS